MTSISVAICSFNGAIRLPRVLDSVASQVLLYHIDYDVIFVDNNSTDNSSCVVEDYWSRLKTNIALKIVHEKRQGLCYAREAAVCNCVADFIVFCDDDNWLDPEYLHHVHLIMESNSLIGALGGASVAATEAIPPTWFSTEACNYAVGSQAKSNTLVDVTNRGYLWGAGLALRTKILKRCFSQGVRPLLTGRSGNVLLAGDDSEICAWSVIAGYKLYFSPMLKFTHFMPETRLTVDNLNKMKMGFRASSPYLKAYRLFARLPPFRLPRCSLDILRFINAFFILLFNPVITYRVWINSRKIKCLFTDL